MTADASHDAISELIRAFGGGKKKVETCNQLDVFTEINFCGQPRFMPDTETHKAPIFLKRFA